MTLDLKEIATIEKADLGYEDHGILTIMLHFKGEGWGQGYGGFSYKSKDGYTVEFAKTVARLLKVFGVYDWSQLVGKLAWVYRDKPFGNIVAIQPIDFNRSTTKFSFKEVFDGMAEGEETWS